MNIHEKMIPYCGNCSRKTKKEGQVKDEYYCDVLIDTPMKGIVTLDTDGTRCIELGFYKPIEQRKNKIEKVENDNINKRQFIELWKKNLV